MNELERQLREGGKKLHSVGVPEDLEGRLQNALKERGRRKSFYSRGLASIAAVLCLLIFTGYHFDTLAYYGKRLIGYDQVMDGNLKNLNELGRGQSIDQSHTFKNGIKLTVDGVMVDDNQLLLFYTLKAPQGKADLLHSNLTLRMEGFFGEYFQHYGEGIIDEDNQEVRWKLSFEPPKALERKLTLEMALLDGEVWEGAEIDFKLDREKAMGHTLKRSLNKSLEIEGVELNFESLIASPTQTVIRGSFPSPLKTAMNRMLGEFNTSTLDVSMIVDGQVYEQRTAGISNDIRGSRFELTYEALPDAIETLEFVVDSLAIERSVNEKINLVTGQAQSLEIKGKEIDIQEVQEKEGGLWITFSTLDGVRLSRVKLLVDGETVDIQETHSEDYIKTAEGEIYCQRTMVFPAQGKSYELLIEKMRSVEATEKGFSVPLN